MQINTTDPNSVSGFYTVDFATFAQTLEESQITASFELGGVAVHHGIRNGYPVWLLDNPMGKYGIWIEENGHCPH